MGFNFFQECFRVNTVFIMLTHLEQELKDIRSFC